MDKYEARQWIELGKMFKKLKDVESVSEVMFNFRTDTYDMVKQAYFKECLGIKETVIEELDLDEGVWEKLCEMADEQDILVDEVVANLLREYLDKFPKNYKLLNKGDIIEDGDQFYSVFDTWENFFPEVSGDKLNIDRPVRRLIK